MCISLFTYRNTQRIFKRTSKERETFFLHIWKLKKSYYSTDMAILQYKYYLQYALVNMYVDTCTKHQRFTKLVTYMYKIYKEM